MASLAALLPVVASLLLAGTLGGDPPPRPLRGSPAAAAASSAAASAAAPSAAEEEQEDGDGAGGEDGARAGTQDLAGARRLALAIDACPTDWEDYFAPVALEWVCACDDVRHRLHTHFPDLTNDHYHKHEACPTTTARAVFTPDQSTTTSVPTQTHTVSSTSTLTTPFCEACNAITAGPPTRTSTSSITSTTKTKTATITVTTSTTLTKTVTTASTTSVTQTGSLRRLQQGGVPDTTVSSTTSTGTTLTSTTSFTLTSTTRTTTVLQPCSICPLYHFLCPDGCQNCVSPGMCRTVYHREEEMFDLACDHRRAVVPPDPCVEFVAVQVSCPAGNLFESRPVNFDSGRYPRLKCRVCGMDHLPADANPKRGHWSGRVSWGPNQFQRAISEVEIHSYKLYLVDTMYQKIGEPLAIREVKLWHSLSLTCCDTAFYHADLDVVLPQDASYFMVVPVTVLGLEINVGPVSERIVDNDRVRGVARNGARRAGLALQAHLLSALLLLLLIAPGSPPPPGGAAAAASRTAQAS